MRFGDMLTFRKDLFFEGAVQADWFYQPDKAALVSENFVFHGSEYYGVGDSPNGQKFTDTIRFTKSIAQKVYDDQPGNALTLAIAGYGTGKSHLAVTLATLLSGKEYLPEAYLRILKNISGIDSKSADEIKSYTQRPNLVLVLNGMRDFNLHYELLKAAQKSLKLYGCDATNLKKLNRAIETAFRFFERNAENMQSAFESFASSFGYHEKGKALIEKLRAKLGEDENAFNIINAVYEDLNGHAIRWDEGISATAVLETLMSEYCGISGPFSKIIIIFDEFGRYLEYASSTTTAHSGDSALQQIFECAQNFGGSLQVINFIQADIKAYLQRVDQSTNISRYIGRYDASEKYRLSSNLETIFANLIQRSDKAAFDASVVAWQKSQEQRWKTVFESLNQWLPTTGIWRDYSLFRKVAVEGIYPLHPLSTYMLTKLSDYLQNRSSLMLLSRYIDDLSSAEIIPGQPAPLVLPEALLTGDLFTEMLAAEEEGRQVSQHCIRYSNVIRKYGDKLSENSKKVLRANLALRILRCRTTSYADASNGLSIFSGLDEETVKSELVWLENEYAVIAYDEHAACFDFLEDSSGAHDFKTHFRRLRASAKFDEAIFEDSAIRELAEVIQNQDTNFAVKHKISTNEWQFTQELFPIADLSEAYIMQCKAAWSNTISSDKAKGRLIWLYTDNDTSEELIDKACKCAGIVSDAPIVLMQMSDSKGLLKSALCDYQTLQAMSDADQQKYGRHYLDKLQQTENSIRQSFENLKKDRLRITATGVETASARLAPALTGVFEAIYPKAVSFDFDGFASKQPGKARKHFCSIVRLLLSEQISENTVHSFPADVRNRFDATLFASSAASWKIVNTDYQIIPPLNKTALVAYNAVVDLVPEGESIKLGNIVDMLAAPPYGMNDYEAVYMIAAVFANLSYCMRVELKNVVYTVTKWKDLVIGDSKIDLAAIKESIARRINAGAVADQFLGLFNRINSNTDTAIVAQLQNELNNMLLREDVPEALSAQLQLAKNHLQEGNRVLRNWDNTFDSAMSLYEKLLSRQDFYSGLQCIKELKGYAFYRVFADTNYKMSEEQEQQIQQALNDVTSKVSPYLGGWISQQRCRSVETMSGFKNFMNKLVELLDSLGYVKEARKARDVAEKELSNIEAIRERQELNRKYKAFTNEAVVSNGIAYVRLTEWKNNGTKLIESIARFKDFLGADADTMKTTVEGRLSEINSRIEEINGCMTAVYDAFYSISSVDDINQISTAIKQIGTYGIPESDMEDFLEIDAALANVLQDIAVLMEEKNNRSRFNANYSALRQKYEEADMEFDVLSVLDGVAEGVKNELDRKDNIWLSKHLSQVPANVPAIHTWLQDTDVLPTYLSEDTITAYNDMHKKVEAKLSEAKVKDIVLRFKELSASEQTECFGLISQAIKE